MTPNEAAASGGEETTSLNVAAVVNVVTTTADIAAIKGQVSATATSETATATPETETTDTPTETTKNDDAKKTKKVKPRILKTQQHGIYTIDTVESPNLLVEWYKGLKTSAPYMYKLLKTYWSLSPTRASLLFAANLCKALLPSFELWVSKGFLDQVQQAAKGSSIQLRKLLGLALLAVVAEAMEQGLEILTYFLSLCC
jgi:hypothetical protein